jgi:hypothetical protein
MHKGDKADRCKFFSISRFEQRGETDLREGFPPQATAYSKAKLEEYPKGDVETRD